jgi:hypothetical protein
MWAIGKQERISCRLPDFPLNHSLCLFLLSFFLSLLIYLSVFPFLFFHFFLFLSHSLFLFICFPPLLSFFVSFCMCVLVCMCVCICDYIALCNEYRTEMKFSLSFLAYFPQKGNWGLWDHHPVCLSMCPPLITFEPIGRFLWNLVGRSCHWRWPRRRTF